MRIIVAGAGAVGFHLSELLSKESQTITVIDVDGRITEKVGEQLDVLAIKGDATLPTIMEDAGVASADLVIAVTTSEKVNLLIAILAKKLGAQMTIARIDNPELLQPEFTSRYSELGIDALMSPHLMAAEEVSRLLSKASLTDLYEFEQGQISIAGFVVDQDSPWIGQRVGNIETKEGREQLKFISMLRSRRTLIPDHNTTIREGDHFYVSATSSRLSDILSGVGQKIHPIKRVMIIGDTPLALQTANMLQDRYDVTVVMDSEQRGEEFLAALSDVLVIIADISDFDLLEKEGLKNMDAFVALTANSETNIITSLMAKESGIFKTIALVDNVDYTHISQNIGVDTIINKKLIAANNIFRFVRRGKVEAIASLHGVDAEVIEFEIPKKKRLITRPVKEIDIPEGACLAGIIRNGTGYIPGPDNKFRPGDKAIVLVMPQAIRKVEKIFAQ